MNPYSGNRKEIRSRGSKSGHGSKFLAEIRTEGVLCSARLSLPCIVGKFMRWPHFYAPKFHAPVIPVFFIDSMGDLGCGHIFLFVRERSLRLPRIRGLAGSVRNIWRSILYLLRSGIRFCFWICTF